MIADVQVASLDYFTSCLMLLFGGLPVLRGKKMVKLRETNRRTHFFQEKAILKIEIFEYYRILTSLQKEGNAKTMWWQLQRRQKSLEETVPQQKQPFPKRPA